MKLLDLFCGAGGAAMGYSNAGFEVIGVDIDNQPSYPFSFHQEDALEFLKNNIKEFNAIHASPPCQSFSAYRHKGHGVGDGYPNLIEPTRKLLKQARLPFVIENVVNAPLIEPIQLCGSSFGLDVRRHRLFECSFPVQSSVCKHSAQKPRFPCSTNRSNLRKTVEIGVWRIPLKTQQQAMEINWMTLKELSQAVPPAYTEYIARALISSM